MHLYMRKITLKGFVPDSADPPVRGRHVVEELRSRLSEGAHAAQGHYSPCSLPQIRKF